MRRLIACWREGVLASETLRNKTDPDYAMRRR